MEENSKPQLPVPIRPNWWLFCTGGLLTTGGLGWCLRLAYAEKPKTALASYVVGSVGVCLSNLSYLPVERRSTGSWILMLTGGILSGAGFGYCLTLAMKEHPKSAIIAYLGGSLGYILVNASFYATTMSEIKGAESRYSDIEISPGQMSRAVRVAKETLDEDVCQCLKCTDLTEGAEKKCGRVPCRSIEKYFKEKMQVYNPKNRCENSTADTRTGPMTNEEYDNEKFILQSEIGEDKRKDETTQTDSRRRVMGTQTQAIHMVYKEQGKIQITLPEGFKCETSRRPVN